MVVHRTVNNPDPFHAGNVSPEQRNFYKQNLVRSYILNTNRAQFFCLFEESDILKIKIKIKIYNSMFNNDPNRCSYTYHEPN